MKKSISYLAIIALLVTASCANEADPQAEKSFFTKFYDNATFNIYYTPLDAVQTADGGYVVLGIKRRVDPTGASIDPGLIYLMKTDEFGTFISDTELDKDLVTPAPALLDLGGKFYFFCMATTGLSTQLIEVGGDGKVVQQLNVGGSYPLAASVSGTELLLLSYDVGNKESVLRSIAADGRVVKSKSFTIGAGDGPEGPIIDHILNTGRKFPFQAGKTTSGTYFFNGFYNYTLSVVFTDLNANTPAGVIQGNQDDGGMSNLVSLAGGKFAAARFNFGDNYLLPAKTLNGSGASAAADLGGNAFPELAANAPVAIVTMPVKGTERIIYGSNTKGKQIALFGYNTSDGAFVGSKYIGFSNTFEIASLTPTKDEGLLVLGTTYIAGRFPRICVFKLSAEALGKSFQ